MRQTDFVPSEVGHDVLRDIAHRLARHEGQCEAGVDKRPAELRLRGVVGVKVQRSRVLRQQREPDVVLLGKGTPEGMPILVVNFEVFIEPAAPAFFDSHLLLLRLVVQFESTQT